MNEVLLVVLVFLIIILIGMVSYVMFRKTPTTIGGIDLTNPLHNLTQEIQRGHSQVAVLSEKVATVESVVPMVTSLQTDIRTLAERTSNVEKNQSQVRDGLVSFSQGLAQMSTMTRSLVDTTNAINVELSHTKTNLNSVAERISKVETNQNNLGNGLNSLNRQMVQTDGLAKGLVEAANSIKDDLSHARTNLSAIQEQAKARHEVESRTADSIRRLETVIAGTQSKGAAGENILDAVFSKLPIEWQVRNFQVNGKPCEFGLRLPNNLILPIDSKWAATQLIERFAQCDDVAEQVKLKAAIESVVLSKAKEVKKYIDPNITVGFGIAAVPDAVYDISGGAMCDAFKFNVVLVPYSMFVPYLMLIFQVVSKDAMSMDVDKVIREVKDLEKSVNALQEELDGRFSRSLTMLTNSRADMSAHIGSINARLTGFQISGDGIGEQKENSQLSLEP